MAAILFVSEKKSFTVTSLTKLLEEQRNIVIHTSCDPSEVEKVIERADIILVNAEEQNLEGLVYIKDRVIENVKPILVFGDSNQVGDVEDAIPSHYIKKKFLRPFNVKDVADEISKYAKDDNNYAKKKILVVDDSGTALRSIKGWLEGHYQVSLANSGVMAIKYLATNRPDLILLDYEMPVCDGKQVLEMIRSESDFSNIPVIFLTNKNDRESVLNVSSLKPDGYLLKTMEPGLILDSINNFFGKKKWDM